MSDPYEVPDAPDLRLDTVSGDPGELVAQVIEGLERLGYLSTPASGRPAE